MSRSRGTAKELRPLHQAYEVRVQRAGAPISKQNTIQFGVKQITTWTNNAFTEAGVPYRFLMQGIHPSDKESIGSTIPCAASAIRQTQKC